MFHIEHQTSEAGPKVPRTVDKVKKQQKTFWLVSHDIQLMPHLLKFETIGDEDENINKALVSLEYDEG